MTAVMMFRRGAALPPPRREDRFEKAAAQNVLAALRAPRECGDAQWAGSIRRENQAVVNSGDTVAVETLPHAMGQIKPGVSIDEIAKLRLENPGGGPHSVTGPIYVRARNLATR